MAINDGNNKMEVDIIPKIDEKAMQDAVYKFKEIKWNNGRGSSPAVSSDKFTGLLNARGNGYVQKGDYLTIRDLAQMFQNNGIGSPNSGNPQNIIKEFLTYLRKNTPNLDKVKEKKFYETTEFGDLYSPIFEENEKLKNWMVNQSQYIKTNNNELQEDFQNLVSEYKKITYQIFKKINENVLKDFISDSDSYALYSELGDMASLPTEIIEKNKAKQAELASRYSGYNNPKFDDDYNLELTRRFEREERKNGPIGDLTQMAKAIREKREILPEESNKIEIESINNDIKTIVRFLTQGELLNNVPNLSESLDDDLSQVYLNLQDLSNFVQSDEYLNKFLSFSPKSKEEQELLSKELPNFFEVLQNKLIEYTNSQEKTLDPRMYNQLKIRIAQINKILGTLDYVKEATGEEDINFSDKTLKTFWNQLQEHIPFGGKNVYSADAMRSFYSKQGINVGGNFPVADIPQYLTGSLPFFPKKLKDYETEESVILDYFKQWLDAVNTKTKEQDNYYDSYGIDNENIKKELQLALQNVNKIYSGLEGNIKNQTKSLLNDYNMGITAGGSIKPESSFTQEDYNEIINLIQSKKDSLTGKSLVNAIYELRKLRNGYLRTTKNQLEIWGNDEDKEIEAIEKLLKDFNQEDFSTSELNNIINLDEAGDYLDIDIDSLEKEFNKSGEEIITRQSLEKRKQELLNQVPDIYANDAKQVSELLSELEYNYIEQKLKPFLEKYLNAQTPSEKRQITKQVKDKYKGTKDESAYLEQWKLYKDQMLQKLVKNLEEENQNNQEILQEVGNAEKNQGEELQKTNEIISVKKSNDSEFYIDELVKNFGTETNYTGPGIIFENEPKFLSEIKKEFEFALKERREEILKKLKKIYESFTEEQKEEFEKELNKESNWKIFGEKINLNSLKDNFYLDQNNANMSSSIKNESTEFSNSNKELKEHVENLEEAKDAEKGKLIISENLTQGLKNEEQSFDQVNKKIKEHQKIFGKVYDINSVSALFNKDSHQYSDANTGEKFYSVTQLRDALLRGRNPSFKEDLERIKTKANYNAKNNLGPISNADFEGMKENDYKFMVENVIGQGIIGDLFHSIIDKLVKSDSKTLEELKEKNKKAYDEYIQEYEASKKEFEKFGLDTALLDMTEKLESYMDAVKKSGMTATQFSEQMLAFEMNGERGKIKIGVTPDQLYSMGDTGALVDNKLGNVKGYESYQLTAQMLGILNNLDTEVNINGEIKKVKDIIGNIDTDQPFKAYIADIEDGLTQLKEYILLSRDEFYNLSKDAEEVLNGEREHYNQQEIKEKMYRQLKTGTFVGTSNTREERLAREQQERLSRESNLRSPDATNIFSEDYLEVIRKLKEEIQGIDATSTSITERFKEYSKAVKDWVKAYTQVAKYQENIEAITKKIQEIENSSSTDKDNQLKDLKEQLSIQQKMLDISKKQVDLANQRREETNIDYDVINGNLEQKYAQKRKDIISSAQSQAHNDILNSLNKNEGKTFADDIVKANKLVKEYEKSIKEQYKLKEKIYALDKKMENQSGEALNSSQLYRESLNNQLKILESSIPLFNEQDSTLNGIKLTSDQIVSLEKIRNNLSMEYESNIQKINASQREQRNILEEIAGGFRQAFRNLTDASIAYEIIGQIRNAMSQLLELTKELDSSMVDLQIASGATREEIKTMMKDYNQLGQEIGKTTVEIAQGANDWLRAGYEGAEAMELTRASTQLATLGMIDTADATSYLISVLKGWKLEASEVTSVVDKLTVIICGVCLVIGIGHKFNCR